MNDFSFQVATVNGSGSQSSNLVLAKTLFRLGLPVGAKNLFPSNIAGLPTWFSIRVNEKGHVSRKQKCDLMVAMNKETLVEDISQVRSGGVFIYNGDIKFDQELLRSDLTNLAIPFRDLVKQVTDSVKLKKLLTNMVYVGVLCELFGIEKSLVEEVVADQFKTKPGVIEINQKAIEVGYNYAREHLEGKSFPLKVSEIPNGNKNKILMDGNTAGAMGLLFGGCSFLSWYPITPSSSLAETFTELCERYRKTQNGKNTAAIVQAEDELSAISMVMGAGWAGARAATTTSGPGLSLMAEAAGLSYFAEVPSVIWNVQRVGPSTGLPTRTMQGDLESAYRLSHGDTEHIVLLPGNLKECFEFGQLALDLADRFQSLVIVLSDLDLGMNMWVSEKFEYPKNPFDRGKVKTAQDLESLEEFRRYADVDGDGITHRTYPGTDNPKAAYFSRGTGHTETSAYSENNENYRQLLDRLKKKMKTARSFVPTPVVDIQPNAKTGIICFGSSDLSVEEMRHEMRATGDETSCLRLRALPFHPDVENFIAKYDRVLVIEQNRDQQLFRLLKDEYPQYWERMHSIHQYDGLPLSCEYLLGQVQELNL